MPWWARVSYQLPFIDPEHPVTLVVEGAGHDGARGVGAGPALTLPAAHCLGVGPGIGHVGQWDVEAALQGPQLVHALDR
jgi:hypothetical protein